MSSDFEESMSMSVADMSIILGRASMEAERILHVHSSAVSAEPSVRDIPAAQSLHGVPALLGDQPIEVRETGRGEYQFSLNKVDAPGQARVMKSVLEQIGCEYAHKAGDGTNRTVSFKITPGMENHVAMNFADVARDMNQPETQQLLTRLILASRYLDTRKDRHTGSKLIAKFKSFGFIAELHTNDRELQEKLKAAGIKSDYKPNIQRSDMVQVGPGKEYIVRSDQIPAMLQAIHEIGGPQELVQKGLGGGGEFARRVLRSADFSPGM